jgi:hypothetical protein
MARLCTCWCGSSFSLVLPWSNFWSPSVVEWEGSIWWFAFGFLHCLDWIGLCTHCCLALLSCLGLSLVISFFFFCA